MKLPDLRKALRALKPSAFDFEASVREAREFQKTNIEGIEVAHVQTARGAGIDDSRSASFHFASEEERRAATMLTSDVGKLAFQTDNSKLYILIAIDTSERVMKGAGTWQEVLT